MPRILIFFKPNHGLKLRSQYCKAPVAQRIEHLTTDQKVWGSNPYGRAVISPVNTGTLAVCGTAMFVADSQSDSQFKNISLRDIYIFRACQFAHLDTSWEIWQLRKTSSAWLEEWPSDYRGLFDLYRQYRYRFQKNSWFQRVKPLKEIAMEPTKLFTIDEACSQLSISKATLYRLISSKQVVCLKIGRSSRISSQALERFISNRTAEVYDAWS